MSTTPVTSTTPATTLRRVGSITLLALLTLSAPALAQTAAMADTVGLDGYCPVCILDMKKWEKGDPRFATVYDGVTYHFPGERQKAAFDANPGKYAPAAGGDCVVCQVEMGASMPGRVEFSALQGGRLFLFPSQKEKDVFLANPAKYAQADLAYDGDCAVCKIKKNHSVAGSADFATYYDGKRYLFPSDRERQAFLADPRQFAER